MSPIRPDDKSGRSISPAVSHLLHTGHLRLFVEWARLYDRGSFGRRVHVTSGDPALAVEWLAGLHDGHEHRYEFAGYCADGFGALIAISGEHGFVLRAIEATRIYPPTRKQEELLSEHGAAALRLAHATSNRSAALLS